MQGLRELQRALAELPKATAKNVLRRVAKGALQPLADDAKGKAPRDRGDLAESIKVSSGRTRRAKAKAKLAGNRASPKTSVQMSAGPSGGGGVLQYAAFEEFGTANHPAQPYMRPAWDAGAEGALDHIKSELGAEIEKAARRLARKAKKKA